MSDDVEFYYEYECDECDEYGAFDFNPGLMCAACASGNHEVKDD